MTTGAATLNGRGLVMPSAPARPTGSDPAKSPRLMMIAGEASGDAFAADLASAILARQPEAIIFGLGGQKLAAAGAKSLTNIVNNLAIIGLTGVLKNYVTLRRLLASTYEVLERDRPDAVILVDYPGFNQRVAERASELGIPVIYYICPQFWAWNERRKWKLARIVDMMMVIFRFEEGLCREVGINAHYVGHPMLKGLRVSKSKDDVRAELGLSEGQRLIGLLPGSRKSEVVRLLPIMVDGVAEYAANDPKAVFAVIRADTIPKPMIDHYISRCAVPIRVIDKDRTNVRAACDFAWVASGTATLETAVLQVPLAIIYTVSFLTWIIGQRLVRTPYIGLVNIVAENRIVPELLQDQATGTNLAGVTLDFFRDEKKLSELREDLRLVRESLGSEPAAERAAAMVIRFLAQVRATSVAATKADMLRHPPVLSE